MNVAILKTKAEQALVENFEAARAALPGNARMGELRSEAIGTFAALGLPHRRIEEWKYTDIRERLRDVLPSSAAGRTAVDRRSLDAGLGRLAALAAWRIVFVDGRFAPELSDAASLPDAVVMRPLTEALTGPASGLEASLRLVSGPDRNAGDSAIDALNLAYVSDGAVLMVRGEVDRPLLIVFARSRAGGHLAMRNLIRVEAGSRATVIEAHVVVDGAETAALGTFVTEVDVGEGAHLSHVQSLSSHAPTRATHLGNWRVCLGKDAIYRGFHLTSDVALVRNDVSVTFADRGAKLDFSGCFLGRGRDHIDETLVIDHAVPGCESRELFKGVLDDRARGIIQGKVIVRPHAQKTDGKQMAQALMLSPDAEFDSKPELEIYADDVVCGHGSTAAELDEDLLFYCRSRGIPLDDARALLIESFVGEAFDKIEDDAVRRAMAATALDWLHRKSPRIVEHNGKDAETGAAG